MPLELQPGEQPFFPQPFIPTEPHLLVITNRRVVQYAPMGPYPIAEFEVGKIDFIGRSSERPLLGMTIVVAILGLILFIVGAWKVLPPVLFAGAQKANPDEAELTDDGRLVEGKNSEDDYPFFDKEVQESSLRRKAEKLKKLRNLSPGIPAFTKDLIWGLVLLAAGAGAFLVARKLYRKEDYFIFCRVGEQVHTIQVPDSIQQNVVLSTLTSAKQAAALAPK